MVAHLDTRDSKVIWSTPQEQDMQSVELSADSRSEHGKGPSRRLRNEGKIPAVLYSAGKAPVVLSVVPKALQKALSGPLSNNTLISLQNAGGKRNVMVK